MIRPFSRLTFFLIAFLLGTNRLFAQADANGVIYATNHGSPTTTPTGIKASITLCGTTNPCTVVIPPNYGVEGVPGSDPIAVYAQPNTFGQGTAGSIPSNVTIIDQRGGGAVTVQNNENYASSNVVTSSLLNCSHSNAIATVALNLFCQSIIDSPNAGGSNYNYGPAGLSIAPFPTGNITNWSALQVGLISSTPGQAIGASFEKGRRIPLKKNSLQVNSTRFHRFR